MQLMGVWGFLPLELWCVCVCVCVCVRVYVLLTCRFLSDSELEGTLARKSRYRLTITLVL